MFLAQSISQIIIMYLIEKLSKPMVLKSSADPEEKESTDYESEELRASMSSDF